MNRLIVVDGNPLMYRAYHSPGFKNLKNSKGVLSGGFYGFLRSYLTLRKRFTSSHFIFCFDSGRSWRNEVFPGYKTHAENPKPNGFLGQLADVRDFLSYAGVPVYMEPMLEADDLISVFSYGWTKRVGKYTSIIVSSDRDFFQLVDENTMVYDDRAKKFYGPTEVESSIGTCHENFLTYKCLIGDISDKIPGVIGYGPVKARKFCNNPDWVFFGEDNLRVYKRNKNLIKLPKVACDLHVSKKVQDWYKGEISRVFSALNTGNISWTYYPDHAKALIDHYECKSLTLGDFI